MTTSALGVLLQARGTSVYVGLSSPLVFPLCSPFILGSPLVGLLTGAFRSLCLISVCPCFPFSVVLVCFIWRPPTSGEQSFLFPFLFFSPWSSCPLLMLVLRLSVVCFSCGDAACCSVCFLFLLVLPRALCIFFLWWGCVGGSWLFSSLLA